jgi:hypothetical protein
MDNIRTKLQSSTALPTDPDTSQRSDVPIKLLAVTKLPAELGLCRRSFDRRRQDDPDFPPTLMIRGRGYIQADLWESYKSLVVRRALARPVLSPLAKRRAKERLAEGSAV